MPSLEFPSGKKKIGLLASIILLNLITANISTRGFFGNLYFFSGGLVWLPVIATYALMLLWNRGKYYEFTFYKIFGFLVGDIIVLVHYHLYVSSEDALFIMEIYQLFGIPFQIISILVIDSVGKIANRKNEL